MRTRSLSSLLLLLSASVHAMTTVAPSIEEANWETGGDIFACHLQQSIPDFGLAVFRHGAGDQLRFTLEANRPRWRPGEALLVAEQAVWQPAREPERLGYVPVDRRNHVKLDAQQSEWLLGKLLHGFFPTFTRQRIEGGPMRVAVSPLRLAEALEAFKRCEDKLLPVNFDQISRTRILFATDKSELSPAARETLDLVVLYSQADDTIVQLYVDGHTDSIGRRLYNIDLSQARAEAVLQYLVDKGIAREKIIVRYHGERYPVSTNATAEGRANNRRVTIRLSRELAPVDAGSAEPALGNQRPEG